MCYEVEASISANVSSECQNLKKVLMFVFTSSEKQSVSESPPSDSRYRLYVILYTIKVQ